MPRFVQVDDGVVTGVLSAESAPTTDIPPGRLFINVEAIPEVMLGWQYDTTTGVFSEEVPVDAQKLQYVESVQGQMTKIGQTLDHSPAMIQAFADRGYDPAAYNPITDADLVDFGVNSYELGVAISILQQILNLIDDPANAVLKTVILKWREM